MRESIIIGATLGLLFAAVGAVVAALAVKYATPSILWDWILGGGAALFLVSLATLALYVSSQLSGRSFLMPALLVDIGICFVVGGVIWHFSNVGVVDGTKPDVTLRFQFPASPVLVLTNESSVIAKNIKYSVYLWNMDDPRTYANPDAAKYPNMHDPLLIPTSTFEFLRPHQSSAYLDIFGTSLVRPFLKQGNRLIGTASVDCPDCEDGHTYIVDITWGEGGWYYEIRESLGEKLKGRTLIPEHTSKEAVQIYHQKMLALAPESERIPIR